MDKSGTLPIYMYDNTAEERYTVIEEEVRTPEIQIEEYADDIEVSESSVQTTSYGRRRRPPKSHDEMVNYKT